MLNTIGTVLNKVVAFIRHCIVCVYDFAYNLWLAFHYYMGFVFWKYFRSQRPKSEELGLVKDHVDQTKP